MFLVFVIRWAGLFLVFGIGRAGLFLVADIGRAGLFLVAVGLACFSSWLPSLLVLFGDVVLF